MSVLQIELPDETVRQLEARAAAQNLDVQSWLREYIEGRLREDAEAAWEEEKLLEALDSPTITATSEWWEKTIADLNGEVEAQVRSQHKNEEQKRAA